MTRETSLVDLTERALSRNMGFEYHALDALRSEIEEKNVHLERQFYQLLNSRSWKWTLFLRKLYGVFVRRDKLLLSSLVPSFFGNVISDFSNICGSITKFSHCFLYSIFTVNGIKARFLKIEVSMLDDFPIARNSLKKSRFVKCSSQSADIILHITEDIFFSPLTIFEFARSWIKYDDNSTLYCDVLDTHQINMFEKPNWNSVYNSSIKLFPPIYLESAKFTSLNPKKLQTVVIRPLGKLGLIRNKALTPPATPRILLPSISRTRSIFSIVVPTANKRIFLKGKERWLIRDFIEDVHSTQKAQLPEIVVVHNEFMSSTDQRALRQYTNVRLVLCSQKTLNLSSKINLGVREASCEKLIISNDDVRSKSSEWLDACLSWLEIGSTGIVGPQIFYENGLLQYAGVEVLHGVPQIIGYKRAENSLGLGFSYVVPREVSAVTGVLMATKKSLFMKIKGWDPKLKINFNDIDYCLRAQTLGFKVIYEPRAQIFHLESASRDLGVSHIPEENFFIERYKDVQPNWPSLIYDSAENANLSFTWRQNYAL